MKDSQHSFAVIEGWLSIGVNVLLAVAKFWAGAVSGSLAIVADGWHTLSDSLSSLVLLIGARKAAKPADQEHPFGHGRADLVAAIIIGVLLGMVGINYLIEAVEGLQVSRSAEFGAIAIAVTAASVVIKELLAQFAFWGCRRGRGESRSLNAEGWHHRGDAITSALILLGIVFARRFWWLDGVLAVLVALLLLRVGYRIIRDSAFPLLGEPPSDRTVRRMREIASRISPGIGHLHHVHVHRYGDHTELTCHVRMDGDMTVDEAHGVVASFEGALREELGVEPTVHVDPKRGTPEEKKP